MGYIIIGGRGEITPLPLPIEQEEELPCKCKCGCRKSVNRKYRHGLCPYCHQGHQDGYYDPEDDSFSFKK